MLATGVGDYLLLLYHGSANFKRYTAENNMYRRVSRASDNQGANRTRWSVAMAGELHECATT